MYECKVVCDSIAPNGVRLTSLELTLPRFVLSELNTHGVITRNSASSRAIPVEKQLKRVKENPFVPEAFAANKRGMQAGEGLDERDNSKAQVEWLRARDAAVAATEALLDQGVHKQWANRLIEPFMWHTVLMTATEWENWYALRISDKAQPEIAHAAALTYLAREASTPVALDYGDWHLPYVLPEERDLPLDLLVKLSSARCARLSYLTQNGIRDHEQDLRLHNDLQTAGHMSPFAHPAQAAQYAKVPSNFAAPWVPYRKMLPGEAVARRDSSFADVLARVTR